MKRMMHQPGHARGKSRRGVVLVLFAILLFVLLPLVSLLLHTGLVTLSRRQMQTGVNSVALEGLRMRDDDDYSDEKEKREFLQTLMAAIYDDALGAEIEFEEGSGIPVAGTEFEASQRISRGQPYKPELELNLDNLAHGDMVAGHYDGAVYLEIGEEREEIEDEYYQREDFGPDPAGYAFLVRLRRTGNTNPLDNLSGVSSSGPTIPFLFGRGPYGHPDHPEFYTRRARGTIVRATAIARAVPAKTVGCYILPMDGLGDGLIGLGPIWVELSEWNVAADDDDDDDEEEPITIPITVDHFVAIPNQAVSLGAAYPPPGMPEPEDLVGERFIAIYTEITGAGNRVVGFGRGIINYNEAENLGTITRTSTQVASRNASSALLRPEELTGEQWTEILTEHRKFEPEYDGDDDQITKQWSLLTPVLVRTMK